MACAQSCPVITLKIFIKEQVITPMRIALEFFCSSIERAAPMLVAHENARQAIADFLTHFKEIHELSRTRRALNLEIITIIKIELEQRPNQQGVHGQPDGSAP